jgi:arsenate reductase
MKPPKIYHNPRCSKSRQTLELIQKQGYEPDIIKYLETPPAVKELEEILSLLNLQPRDMMRKGESEYKDKAMNNPSLSSVQLIELMHKHPKIIERPIVVFNEKAIIGRPPENVLALF